MTRAFVLVSALLLAGFAGQPDPGMQDQTGKRLDKVKEYVAAAGNLYVDEQFKASARKIRAAQTLLERAIRDGKKEYRKALESEHARIAKAHELLDAQGIKLSTLAPFPRDFGTRVNIDRVTDSKKGGNRQSADSGKKSARKVSFKSQVSPLLVKHCGVCHVRGSRGQFSMSTFENLMDSSTVSPDEPDDSLLIELMESGDMPPSGSMPEKDIELIRKWILQGAEFDGDDKKASLVGNRPGRGR